MARRLCLAVRSLTFGAGRLIERLTSSDDVRVLDRYTGPESVPPSVWFPPNATAKTTNPRRAAMAIHTPYFFKMVPPRTKSRSTERHHTAYPGGVRASVNDLSVRVWVPPFSRTLFQRLVLAPLVIRRLGCVTGMQPRRLLRTVLMGETMSTKRSLQLFVLLIAFGLVASACSSDDSDAGADTTMAADMDMDADHEDGFEFGDPMDAGTATRVIEIDANDDFTFSPGSVAVTAGETVTFRVTNSGVIPHDFVLGDEEMQIEHEAEMAEMAGDTAMHDEPNAFVLEPGETKEMTWHMTATGDVLFGCHQPGHFAAGMKGTVSVSG
jgi:uncharacterized cupredoxin-like copper-binding protein